MFTLCDFRHENKLNKNCDKNLDFVSYITEKWTEIHKENDVFRYKVNDLQEKLVGGYLLQVNITYFVLLQTLNLSY